ncbi:hypothetical protein DPMN_137870 [Dreissena polymorpha]|uniref:Uncharacterized protein n=1 Tax=Dreissena polymorpha TaxID=45954 RepID=A0A9D4G2P2_DREPO|nr:hypothetical protein DPMN_137870 [Dreissena polymorpha]
MFQLFSRIEKLSFEKSVKARSHRQNFAGAFLERYEEEPIFGNARHRAQNGEKIENTGIANAVHR